MALRSLLVRGPFRGASGYDHHVREFVRELARQGVAVQLVDLPEWGPATLPPEQREAWFEALGRPVGAAVALHFCMPHQVTPFAGLANVNFTMFEATRVHPSWIAANGRHDLVVLPTESSRRAWIDSGLSPGKIRLCPLGINPDRFARPAEPLPLRTERGEPVAGYRTRFLNVSELGPRKNLVGLVRAWLLATTADDDAILVVKLGAYAPGRREQWSRQLETVQRELGKPLAAAAPIHVVRAIFSDAEMPRLFAAATHYVSLSHGEGWDQPMVEAAASGLRLIAPDHSAYRAYLDPSVAQLVPSELTPAAYDGDPATALLFVGADWWQPDEAAAVACIRAAIEGRDTPRAAARQRVLAGFTWQQATRRLVAILDEVASRRRLPRLWPRLRWYSGR